VTCGPFLVPGKDYGPAEEAGNRRTTGPVHEHVSLIVERTAFKEYVPVVDRKL
jgi:hypothetical protein